MCASSGVPLHMWKPTGEHRGSKLVPLLTGETGCWRAVAQGLGADEGAVPPVLTVLFRVPVLSSASLCSPRLWGKQQGSCPRVLCRFWGVSQTLPSPCWLQGTPSHLDLTCRV